MRLVFEGLKVCMSRRKVFLLGTVNVTGCTTYHAMCCALTSIGFFLFAHSYLV